ncbi:glycosyltransferase family 87 protein [Luteibaculum oceani]|uniref:DUF2029 domain-containing protein n=1 Tax=Luteibaculum oceani TaxID=1294296 RepID=A0A5C6UVL7_9FLAO|nr:glycosyltransferase family 87 protein [Luteibaculum oceani]TXC76261.1 DUF2029 domain-containing protein [Luteibaculum oceani]
MRTTKANWRLIVFILLIALTLFELIRSGNRDGDFLGYIRAANAVLSGNDIYLDYLNTWPPLFSIFCVPLYFLNKISPYGVRILWLLGGLFGFASTINHTAQLFFNKKLGWKTSEKHLSILNPLLFVPLLLSFRFVLDNLANVQINMYMLWASTLCLVLLDKNKIKLAALVLAISISLKIFTIFLLIYLLYKRHFKFGAYALLFLLILNSIPLAVFGWELGIEYYHAWVTEVAPKSYLPTSRNQSIFGLFIRLFADLPHKNVVDISLLQLQIDQVKTLTYLTICLFGIIPLYLFYKPIKNLKSKGSLIELCIVYTAIPLLTPVAWKAYFIFLWIPITYLFHELYKTDYPGLKKKGRIVFWIGMSYLIFSAEIFVGKWFSDALETIGILTLGSILLIGLLFRINLVYHNK